MADETHSEPERPDPAAQPAKDYSRQLGVVESLVAITNQCPSGPVRVVAQQALEAIKQNEPGVMREQVYFVLTAIQGWRGERARQIHDSLTAFLDASGSDGEKSREK
jgi:hypothetical protein